MNSIITEHQYGFRKSYSTANQTFDVSLQTDAICTNFSKAFDKVNHHKLIKRLELLGFEDYLLTWLISYYY